MKQLGDKIYLRSYEVADAALLAQLHQRNREFFQKYGPKKTEDFYTENYQRSAIEASLEMGEREEQYSFGIFLGETDELIGNIALTEVVRGSLQSCWLGYYLDQSRNGRGYTSEAVRLMVAYAFDDLKLHRIEAGVMPHNRGSSKVLEKAGFHCEGLSKKNVKINGKWEDHLHYALVNPGD